MVDESTTSQLAQETVKLNRVTSQVDLKNGFDAPIPGQSLTKPPRGAAYENPPALVDPEIIAEKIFGNMTTPKQAAKILETLKAGATAESIAVALLHAGVSRGIWTPDIAMLLTRPVTAQITGLALRLGLEDFEVLNPDTKDTEFFARTKRLQEARKGASLQGAGGEVVLPELQETGAELQGAPPEATPEATRLKEKFEFFKGTQEEGQ